MNASITPALKWCALLLSLFPSLAWSSYVLRLTAPGGVTPGTTATFVVSIDDGSGIQSADLDVGYDASALQYQAFRGGTLCTGLDLCFGNDNGASVTIADSFLNALTSGGSLAEIDFFVQSAPAPGSLSLDNIELGLPDATTVPANEITAVVPLPPAWLFTLSGLAALGWRRRTRLQAC